MSWSLANSNGILATGSTQNTPGVTPPQFNAGAINGIVHVDAQPAPSPAITLVSTPTSGVWKLNDPQNGTWTPLSLTWKRPDLTCLVKGHRDSFDVFAAGGGIDGQGTLWENGDWTSAGAFSTWNPIDLSFLQTGTVNGVTSIFPSGLGILVLACDNGIWWSLLPEVTGGVYSFKKAITPAGLVDRWSSAAPGEGKYLDWPLWAAPWGDGSSQPALFRGSFTADPNQAGADLKLDTMDLPGLPPAVFRVLIAAAPTDERKRLLVGGGADGGIAFLFRSTNAFPPTWEAATATVGGVAAALLNPSVTGLLGNWAGGIAFSTAISDDIALGWQSAYFLSTDYGNNWTRVDASNSPNIHAGIHALQFIDEANLQQKSLALATDGGLFTTIDGGHTHVSTANKTFPNLKFANGALDNHSIGILAGSLSNDLNLYGSVYGTPQLWQPLRNNDVGPVAFLRNGVLLDYDNLQSTNASTIKSLLQGRRLDPFNQPPGYTQGDMDPLDFNDNTTLPGSGLNIDATVNLRPLEPVDVPLTVDINSDSLVAVAGRQSEICGVILSQQDAVHDNIAVHVLGSPTASETITAVASSDGSTVIVGTNAGNFFSGSPVPGASSFSFNFVPMTLTTPPPNQGLPITKISARKGNRIFAIAKGTQLLRLEGSGWSHIPKPHVLEEFTALLAVPSETSLFVSTPSRIFQSKDDGNTWTNITSVGLPAFAHIIDMKHIKEPGGASVLYAFTDGWSVFKRILNQPTIPIQRAVTVKGVMGVTYSNNTSNFNVNDGALLGFNQGAWVFDFVHANGNVFADMRIRATFQADESVEVVSSLWLNNFVSKSGGKTPGTRVVLDPGSSYYQNVHVTVGDGRHDSDGGVVDFDFLITN